MTENIIDVAIVGGGVSGVYTGWRLLTSDLSKSELSQFADESGKLNVQVFELSDRIGGRLISLDPPEMNGIKAEFGGMRYLTNQPLVSGLIDKLGLANKAFPVSGDENIYYLRGKHLRHRDFKNPKDVPYRLSWQEQGKTPGSSLPKRLMCLFPVARI